MKKILFCLGLIIVLFTSCNDDGDPSSVSFVIEPGCGTQLTNISQSIFCRQVSSEIFIYRYRFIVSDAETNVLKGNVDTPSNRFNFLDLGLSNIELDKTYKVEVQVAFDQSLNFTTVINPLCTIRTPVSPEKSSVIIPQCGSVVNSLWTSVFAKQTLGAEKYRFVVVDGTQTRIIETTESSFQLAELPGGPAANTQYFIRVDVLYQGVWYSGEEVCSITTSPTASLRQSNILTDFITKSK